LRDGVSLTVSGLGEMRRRRCDLSPTAPRLSIAGGVTSSAISLTGTSIAITGVVTDGGAGTVTLTATGGPIDEATGTLIAGTLSGSSTGAATLTGASNSIATLGGFTAAGFSLNDGGSLLVSGVVNGGTSATIADSASLSITGTVSATAVSLTGANIADTGLVTDAGRGRSA